MCLSITRLYAAHRLLSIIYERRYSDADSILGLSHVEGIEVKGVLEFAASLGLIDTINDNITITKNGVAVAVEQNHCIYIRHLLALYISTRRPAWSSLALRGRGALNCANANILQCFRESGLMDSLDNNTVQWWDDVRSQVRGHRNDNLGAIGREGERLSVDHETRRIGVAPRWVSLEDDFAGYDIQSWTDGSRSQQMVIEVKASTQSFNFAEMHLTAHEWSVLSGGGMSVIHLWSGVRSSPVLCIASPSILCKHIARNHGSGRWESVAIPFQAAINDD